MAREVKLSISYQVSGARAIKNGDLDLYDSDKLPLALNFSIKSIDNISKSRGSFSKTFDIPATNNNNILLNHSHSDQLEDITDLIDGRIECTCLVNGQKVFQGTLTVKAIIKDNKPHSYKITILGDNNSWVKQFKEAPMCDANRDDFHSFVWSHGAWQWFNDNVPSPIPAHRSIVIPLITWGEHEYPYATLNSFKAHIMEQTPSYSVRYLVYYYFAQAGYELESDFFNSDFFMKLVMPLDPKNFVFPDDLAAEYKYDARFRFDDGTGHSPSPVWNSSYEQERHCNHCFKLSIKATGSNNYKRGISRHAPFDVEITDPSNAGDDASHYQYPYGIPANNGANSPFALARGFRYKESEQGNAQWHWECPQTAQYRVRSWLSLIQGNYSKLHCKITVCSSSTTFNACEQMIGSGASVNNLTNVNGYSGGSQTVLDDDINSYSSYSGSTYREVNLDSGYVTINQGETVIIECYMQELQNGYHIQPSDGYLLTKNFHMYDMQKDGSQVTPLNFPGDGNVRDTRVLIERFGDLAYGDFIHSSDYLPCDETKLDFISGLTGLFNLYWYTDEALKKVYVEPYKDFYKESAYALDWTHKLDMSKPQETLFLTDKLGKDLRFRYKEDSKDGEVEYLESNLGYPYHSTLISLQDEYLPEIEEHGTSFYAPTTSIRDREYIDGNNGDAPWVPLIVKDHVSNVSWQTKPERSMGGWKLRILSYEGVKTFNGTMYAGYKWNDSSHDGTAGHTNEYPCAQTFHDVDDSFGETLDYADNIQDGLYTRFWKPYIDSITSNPRIKECYLYLTPSDIAQLDLRVPIFLVEDGHANGSYWIIEKIIDYKPHEDSVTKVRLLQIGANSTNLKIPPYTIVDEGSPSTGVNDGNQDDGGVGTVGVWGVGTVGIGVNVHTELDKDKDNIVHTHGSLGGNINLSDIGANTSLVLNGNHNFTPNKAGNILIGSHLKSMSGGTGQMILGKYNIDNPKASVIIGGGTSEADRKNILTITHDGAIEFGDIGGGSNMVTTDNNGDYIDLYTESNASEDDKSVSKIIKG
jgi:hypothetical protein